MRIKVVLGDVDLPCGILRVLANDIEVTVSFNKTSRRCSRSR